MLLTYNNSSHIQKLETGAARTHKIEWNSVPVHVVCAFPYILAITGEAVEFRYAVNGSLLKTLAMPDLKLITAKVRVFAVCNFLHGSLEQSYTVRQGCDTETISTQVGKVKK